MTKLILLLAVYKPNIDLVYKSITSKCEDVNYTWTREGSPIVGINILGTDYVTQFKSIDELESELDKQCKRKK